MEVESSLWYASGGRSHGSAACQTRAQLRKLPSLLAEGFTFLGFGLLALMGSMLPKGAVSEM